ncbi:MAG: fatty acyl-AMP ligase [Candidatus Hydrogenedentes bacterium]|nr:fatty acyl-AMP ligase [Candidatus Hydrogenedentota bacterium]
MIRDGRAARLEGGIPSPEDATPFREASVFDKASTLVEVVRAWADVVPEHAPMHFLSSGADELESLSYRGLDTMARGWAACLQERGARGERVLLLYPPGLEFAVAFFACLYAGAVAVPIPPPSRRERIDGVFRVAGDCGAQFVMTTARTREHLQRITPHGSMVSNLEWMATDEALPDGAEDAWLEPRLSGETLAFLQYTSGSTMTPRGVMVSHESILTNVSAICRAMGMTRASRHVYWLPHFHDMGLIGGLLTLIVCGGTTIGMPPALFLQRPLRWLKVISDSRATTAGGPNFAYEMCVRRTTPEQRAGLDLSPWSVAYCGAEPVRHETLERFAQAFSPFGFRREAFFPCYGLAEATLFVSGGGPKTRPVTFRASRRNLERRRVEVASDSSDDSVTLVGCGIPGAGNDVRIVDPETQRECHGNCVGEVWVCGKAVSKGYWNMPGESRRMFEGWVDGAGPFLRTGDLGFLRDGELYITGRIKDVLIISGRNVYPHDIEHAVAGCHSSIRPQGCAAFGVELDGEERLVVQIEAVFDSAANSDARNQMVQAVRAAVVAEFDMTVYEVHVVGPGMIARTSSGKLRRFACKEQYLRAHSGTHSA